MVKNQMLITNGIYNRIPLSIQNLMWYIAKLLKPNAKFQEFSFITVNDDELNQLLIHKVEDLNYIKKYRFKSSSPITETVYIINDLASTMLLAEEY